MELNRNKVLLGLSGGVDSATAALLLKEKGFSVTGYYFDVAGNNIKGRDEAAAVAEQLGIDFIYEDVSKDFGEIVIGNFIDEYLHGRTPNPCVMCNPNVKFKHLIHHADEIGAYYIATGHYCRVFHDENDGKFYIRRAVNEKKDQSYMLYRLGQEVVSRLIFPLGEFLSKDETRELARENSLQNAEKKDSQEICFIPDHDYAGFIDRMEPGKIKGCGNFVTAKGEVLGTHQGITHYTVGQRKGLNLAMGRPVFVTEIRPDTNEVVIGEAEDVFRKEFFADHMNYMGVPEIKDGMRFLTKIRYAHKGAMATLYREDADKVRFVFDEPQRAITPGQAVCFYEDGYIAGGGIIL